MKSLTRIRKQELREDNRRTIEGLLKSIREGNVFIGQEVTVLYRGGLFYCGNLKKIDGTVADVISDRIDPSTICYGPREYLVLKTGSFFNKHIPFRALQGIGYGGGKEK